MPWTFWCILKWEAGYGTAYGNRWLILIAYLIGLSIGVHLLNLLVIPALVLIFYFKRYTFSIVGFLLALLAGIANLALIQFGLLSGFLNLAAQVELFFVNDLHFSFNSGLVVFVGAVFCF